MASHPEEIVENLFVETADMHNTGKVTMRFYKDGDTLIYGHAPHFEHDDHDDHH